METLKDEITGPISGELFRDPVLAADGQTYERESIETWFKTKTTSPLTGLPINRTLIPNQLVKKMVLRYLEAHPEESNGQLPFAEEPVFKAFADDDFSVLKRYHSIPLNRKLEITRTIEPINEHADKTTEKYSLMQLLVDRCDDPEIVEWMLTSADDVEAVDYHGCQLVHYLAGSETHYELLGRFTEKQLNRLTDEQLFGSGLSALGVAIKADLFPAVELISTRVTVDAMIIGVDGMMISYPPVLYAVFLGRIELVKKMVTLGWTLDDYSLSGVGLSAHRYESGLHLLAQTASLPDLLELSKKCPANMWTTELLKRVTALYFAFRRFTEEEIVELVEELIKRRVYGRPDYTILDSACDYNPYSGGLAFFRDGDKNKLRQGVDAIRDRLFDRFNGRFDFGQFDSRVIIPMLVTRDLDFYRRMMKVPAIQEMLLTKRHHYLNRTVLHHAIANRRTDIADALLDDGISLDGVTTTGETVLSYSMQFDYLRGIEAAIEAGIGITQPNVAGIYPIHRLPKVPKVPKNLRMKLIELTPDDYLTLRAKASPPAYEVALLAGLIEEAAEIKRRIGESDDTRRADEKYELTTMRQELTEERRAFEAERRESQRPKGRIACFAWLKKGNR